MAFVAALVSLNPRASTRKPLRESKGVRATLGKRVRTNLVASVCTPHGSPLYQVSKEDGGGKIPMDKRRCCEGEDDENRSFPSILMLFCSKLRICQILLAVNVAVFILQAFSGPGILMAGAKVNSAIANGQYYRLFSPMFLHASATHLAINSFSLHSTGPSVESWFGKRRFMWLYMVSGVCGNALSFACTPTPAVGASGAIFGLVGASAVILARHSKLLGPRARKGLQSLAYIVVMNFGMGLSPGSRIDNFGHLGGFLGGIAYSYFFGPRLVPLRLRSGRIIVRDEPISSLVIRDVRNHLRFIRKLLKVN